METPKVLFHPIISFIQKMALYETKVMFYLIGSNNSVTKFRVLKIDRTDPRDLVIVDDKVEYTQSEIHQLIDRIENCNKVQLKNNTAAKTVSAFGIVGFVRFLEGYYMILMTKRQKVAVIGHHSIYKIKDTAMIYIPLESRKYNPEEQKYVKMFQNIDLSSNFYFSYSYDLTHSLQMNLSSPSDFPLSAFHDIQSPLTNNSNASGKNHGSKTRETEKEKIQESTQGPRQALHFGVRAAPNERFVWNWHLLKPVMNNLHLDWILYITHGFVDQSNVSVYGRSLYITLIARRSNRYAGTRFLKRGANFEGDVANEVETEQVVHDASISSFSNGNFSSFVQMRGSIPGHWSQDISKMVPKPQISFDLSDPYGETSGQHFNQLLKRYGSPIIILNLVKKREKKKHESVLSKEFSTSVRYLNQFIPPKHSIKYVSFDMARMNKLKDENVMQRLTEIARFRIMQTGIFITRPVPQTCTNNSSNSNSISSNSSSSNRSGTTRHQTGVIRVNCVDCLDRTNTAQFVLGKCALGFQLSSLGVLQVPDLEFDSDCVRMLEALYEDHGDTLALQYGGSQLVHRIKTYRKTAPWTSQGNDIMQTLSRYYSNTFSDSEKQNTINLFLGLFVPEEKSPHIWETTTDYYIHHSLSMRKKQQRPHPLTQWWDPEMMQFLPRSYEEMTKKSIELIAVRPEEECVDGYLDYHRPYELTFLSETFTSEISHSVRDFMPNSTTNVSPFEVRIRPGRRWEENGSKNSMKNPSLTGQSSTSSTTSSGSSSASSDSDESFTVDEEFTGESQSSQGESKFSSEENADFKNFFPTMKEVYGMEPEEPKQIILYKRYVFLYINSIRNINSVVLNTNQLFQSNSIPKDDCYETRVPTVSQKSIEKYEKYVNNGFAGASAPHPADLKIYEAYTFQL